MKRGTRVALVLGFLLMLCAFARVSAHKVYELSRNPLARNVVSDAAPGNSDDHLRRAYRPGGSQRKITCGSQSGGSSYCRTSTKGGPPFVRIAHTTKERTIEHLYESLVS
jgi:hypothetical protein